MNISTNRSAKTRIWFGCGGIKILLAITQCWVIIQNMNMKTDNVELVGKHAFEVAGLGKAPFRFVGMQENAQRLPDGTTRAAGCCQYCYTGIRYECVVQSADGKRFVVGSDCIRKVDEAGLYKAYKQSREFRDHQRQLRQAKAAKVREQVNELMGQLSEKLAAMPHPMGHVDRQTNVPLTALDWARWNCSHLGDSSMKWFLGCLQRINAGQPALL